MHRPLLYIKFLYVSFNSAQRLVELSVILLMDLYLVMKYRLDVVVATVAIEAFFKLKRQAIRDE